MNVAVLSLLGMSPPVVTGFVKAFGNVRDVVVFVTENEEVVQGFEIIRVALKLNYPDVRVHRIPVDLEDVITTDDNFRFMSLAARAIKNQKGKYGSERIYLNVSGGRKNMSITLSLLGQLMRVDGVFHVLTPDVGLVNQLLENLRSDIKKIYEAESEEEKLELYQEKRKYFDGLMFPKVELVRLPTIPYPEYYVERILKALYSKELDELTESEKEMLVSHGLLDKMGKRYIVTEFGEKLAKVLATGKFG